MSIRKAIILTRMIEKLDGYKTVTILTDFGSKVFHFNKNIQMNDEHVFYKTIDHGMKTKGSVIIRHSTGKMVEALDEVYEVINIYGIRIGNEKMKSIPKHEMETAYTMDTETGKRIPKEAGVNFCQF